MKGWEIPLLENPVQNKEPHTIPLNTEEVLAVEVNNMSSHNIGNPKGGPNVEQYVCPTQENMEIPPNTRPEGAEPSPKL